MKSMNVTVKQNISPTAALAATPTTGPASLTVTASNAASSDSDGTIVSRTIDFGNGTVVNGTSASYTYTTPGTYTIRTTVTDDGGATSTASQTVTVSAPQPYVNIISPTNNAKVPTAMRVQAKGWAPSGVKVMQVYVDGKLMYQVNSATVDTTINVAAGNREIVVKGWDMLGNSFLSTVTVSAYRSTNITTVF
jgi:PKD repeat protein